MFERFTDRARRALVLAQEEARMLDHNYVGTEHILLGLIHEGEGVAARALDSLGISLDAVRQQVENVIGRGKQAPTGHILLTPSTKKALELSLQEALQLGHNYIGTEHILLGIIRNGEGVAARVLAGFGADLISVRRQVTELVGGHEPERARHDRPKGAVDFRLDAIERRLAAVERQVSVGLDTKDLDEQGTLAERYQQLRSEIDRLRALLRLHGIASDDRPA